MHGAINSLLLRSKSLATLEAILTFAKTFLIASKYPKIN
jgi:hypothetical protein